MKTNNILSKSIISTVYHEDDVVIKAFAPHYPKSMVFHESYVFTLIEETALNVPELLGVETLPDGRWAIVRKYVAGQSLLEMIQQEQPEEFDEYIEKLVETQIGINNIVLGDLVLWRARLERKIQGLAGKYGVSVLKVHELLSELDSMPRHAKLCHGNFSPENLIIDENGTEFIVGWGNAARGNSSAEAANTYLNISGFSTSLAENYLNIYCDYAAVSRRYVVDWIPIMAAGQLADGPKSGLHKELLLAWLDI